LTINNCLNLEEIDVYGNEITEIVGLERLSKLRKLSCGGNEIKKIDVSKNDNLEVLFVQDRNNGIQVMGVENLAKLVKYNGGKDSSSGTLLNLVKVSHEGWEGAAQKLDIDTQAKDIVEVKNLIEKRGNRDRDNIRKINDTTNGLSGLLNQNGEVEDNKLKEINEDQKETKQLHDVNTNPNNNEILESGRFNQGKFDKLVEKDKDYDQLVAKNNNLVENGKISQGKIDDLKNANKDVTAAIDRLGVTDLNIPTLDAKLGAGTKLSNIQTTLKDLLDKIKKFEDALTKAGIDSNSSDLENQLEKLKKASRELEITKILVKAEMGESSWDQLEAYVLVEVANINKQLN